MDKDGEKRVRIWAMWAKFELKKAKKIHEMNIKALFVTIDDFCKIYQDLEA